MANAAHVKNLDEVNFYNSQQSWFAQQHYELNGFKVRVTIKRNAYDDQSSAIAQVLDAKTPKWNTIASIPHPQMKSNGSYVIKSLSATQQATFKQDILTLINKAKMLLA
ncbi:MAG: hypothetical protein WCY71_12330 [Halothiobacillaceae bacterium]